MVKHAFPQVSDETEDNTKLLIAVGDLMMAKDQDVDLCIDTVNDLGYLIFKTAKEIKKDMKV